MRGSPHRPLGARPTLVTGCDYRLVVDDFPTAWLFRKLQLNRLSRQSKPRRSAKPGWYYDREKQAK